MIVVSMGEVFIPTPNGTPFFHVGNLPVLRNQAITFGELERYWFSSVVTVQRSHESCLIRRPALCSRYGSLHGGGCASNGSRAPCKDVTNADNDMGNTSEQYRIPYRETNDSIVGLWRSLRFLGRNFQGGKSEVSKKWD